MTDRQIQLLLAYLGFYEGAIDGIFGKQTREAVVAFQRENGLAPDGVVGEKTRQRLLEAIYRGEDFWLTTPNFTRQEFACPCGECSGFPAEPRRELVALAQKVRSYFGKKCHISSGVRCGSHNARVGGVANSRHLTGKALDFCMEAMPASLVLDYVSTLPEVRYAYAIDTSFVHMDVR